MGRYTKRLPDRAEISLGQRLLAMRKAKGMTTKQLGKLVNVPEQQIGRYEAGAFVTIEMLEALAYAMGEEIPKRLIRRISALRQGEWMGDNELDELEALYAEAVPDILPED
jgi:transcriptional regulator with XRE-family HTH domain